jgi:SAM-dependent methyltransferase
MEAWDKAWQTEEGRRKWLAPDPFVVAAVETLRAAEVRRVLDLGFGVGRHAILLAKTGFEVFGLDASDSGLAYTQAWADQEGLALKLRTGDMAALPYATGFFDALLTWNVIYHGTAETIRCTLGEIERCLRPRGYLVCSLISRAHDVCGQGIEIEPATYVIPGSGEREHPHHYFDRADIDAYLRNFELLRCEDVTQSRATDYHWQILARRR